MFYMGSAIAHEARLRSGYGEQSAHHVESRVDRIVFLGFVPGSGVCREDKEIAYVRRLLCES